MSEPNKPAEPPVKTVYRLHSEYRRALFDRNTAFVEAENTQRIADRAAEAARKAQENLKDAETALLCAPGSLDDHLNELVYGLDDGTDPLGVVGHMRAAADAVAKTNPALRYRLAIWAFELECGERHKPEYWPIAHKEALPGPSLVPDVSRETPPAQ